MKGHNPEKSLEKSLNCINNKFTLIQNAAQGIGADITLGDETNIGVMTRF